MKQTNTTGDTVFRTILFVAAALILLIVAAMIAMLTENSLATIREFGFGFVTSSEWNPSARAFGALPFIYGTIVTAVIALLISVPISLGIAIFLTEQASVRIARPIAFLVELLAAIPSVVYGLWGIFVLAPFIREYLGFWLQTYLGFIHCFKAVLQVSEC